MTKTYRILCDSEILGTSALENRDSGMAIASGRFNPASAYEKVRHVFRLFSDAQGDVGPVDEKLLAEYYRARDELKLSVETDAGQHIATTVVHIADFAEEIDEESYEVEVHIATPAFFEK